MTKRTIAAFLMPAIVLIGVIVAVLWVARDNNLRVERRIFHDQCETQPMNPQVREYLVNSNWQARDMNQYQITCVYITYAAPSDDSELRFTTWYTIHMMGNATYITIPCYNDTFCVDPISIIEPDEIIVPLYIITPIYVMPDESTATPN